MMPTRLKSPKSSLLEQLEFPLVVDKGILFCVFILRGFLFSFCLFGPLDESVPGGIHCEYLACVLQSSYF
jgi:hypothetical protein